MAVSPVGKGGAVNVFTLSDAGEDTKEVLSFAVNNGETIAPGAFACGRCFCLMLGTNFAAKTSTLYNMSFCLVPTPALESQFKLPGIAYNLHSAEGEGDGGSAYTIFINHHADPQTYHVARVSGQTIQPIVDISEFVDNDNGGGVFAGGSAVCA